VTGAVKNNNGMADTSLSENTYFLPGRYAQHAGIGTAYRCGGAEHMAGIAREK
jgi:hypothetical protein